MTFLLLYPNANQSVITQTLAEKYKDNKLIKKVDIIFDKVEVPMKSTGYTCRLYNINRMINPNGNQKDKTGKDVPYHAIAFEPIIDNEKYVHHIVVFACNYKNVFYNEKMFECTNSIRDCFQTLIIWAVGQKAVELPKEAGIMWGSQDSYFVAMQIHYNNPSLIAGQVDSSGFSIYFTPALRKYDMGVSYIGPLINNIEIPAKKEKVVVGENIVCPKLCSNKIPIEGFYISLYSYHAHQ
jgi:hypothetical protein